MVIHRLLVTGTDDRLFQFHRAARPALYGLERRDHTLTYTCSPRHLRAALDVARKLGLGVQEVEGAGAAERYRVLVEPGEGGGLWRPADRPGRGRPAVR